MLYLVPLTTRKEFQFLMSFLFFGGGGVYIFEATFTIFQYAALTHLLYNLYYES